MADTAEVPYTSCLLIGAIRMSGQLTARTGLFIGGGETSISVGGVDAVVVRNPFDNKPYVPGSSLKGKMRCMLERAKGLPLNAFHRGKNRRERSEQLRYHNCADDRSVNQEQYDACPVCNLFGTPASGERSSFINMPTRLIVRDALLTPEAAARLEKSGRTDMPYTEIKTEIGLDRLTSAANPRQRERVPPGTTFSFELVLNLYKEADVALVSDLVLAMLLVEGDYLGGQGSRGYGQVGFGPVTVETRWPSGKTLALPAGFESGKTVQQLYDALAPKPA